MINAKWEVLPSAMIFIMLRSNTFTLHFTLCIHNCKLKDNYESNGYEKGQYSACGDLY